MRNMSCVLRVAWPSLLLRCTIFCHASGVMEGAFPIARSERMSNTTFS